MSKRELQGWILEVPPPDERPAPSPRRLLRWTVRGLVLLLLGLLSTAGVLGYGTWAFAEQHEGRILPGAVIAGVDVGGLTHDQAVRAVDAALADHLAERVAIIHGEERWEISRAALGASTDAEEHVAAALALSSGSEWAELLRMRWNGHLLDFSAEVAISEVSEAARDFVQEVAASVHTDARDAAIEWETGWVNFHHGVTGVHVDVDGTVGDLLAAFSEGGGEVDLRTVAVEPEVTTEDFRQVLLLRQSEHRLYLYQHGEITHSWPVAVGARASGYPTPRGVFHVTLKRHMPTWVNPAPNGWGRGMPAQIGPGPTNPLGVRALNWNASAIRFHGTANVNSIGQNASKGCVRLTNADVVELYDLVEIGATIISI